MASRSDSVVSRDGSRWTPDDVVTAEPQTSRDDDDDEAAAGAGSATPNPFAPLWQSRRPLMFVAATVAVPFIMQGLTIPFASPNAGGEDRNVGSASVIRDWLLAFGLSPGISFGGIRVSALDGWDGEGYPAVPPWMLFRDLWAPRTLAGIWDNIRKAFGLSTLESLTQRVMTAAVGGGGDSEGLTPPLLFPLLSGVALLVARWGHKVRLLATEGGSTSSVDSTVSHCAESVSTVHDRAELIEAVDAADIEGEGEDGVPSPPPLSSHPPNGDNRVYVPPLGFDATEAAKNRRGTSKYDDSEGEQGTVELPYRTRSDLDPSPGTTARFSPASSEPTHGRDNNNHDDVEDDESGQSELEDGGAYVASANDMTSLVDTPSGPPAAEKRPPAAARSPSSADRSDSGAGCAVDEAAVTAREMVRYYREQRSPSRSHHGSATPSSDVVATPPKVPPSPTSRAQRVRSMPYVTTPRGGGSGVESPPPAHELVASSPLMQHNGHVTLALVSPCNTFDLQSLTNAAAKYVCPEVLISSGGRDTTYGSLNASELTPGGGSGGARGELDVDGSRLIVTGDHPFKVREVDCVETFVHTTSSPRRELPTVAVHKAAVVGGVELHSFSHPCDAIYVFTKTLPPSGLSSPRSELAAVYAQEERDLSWCDHHVYLSQDQSYNSLAALVNITLYDRVMKIKKVGGQSSFDFEPGTGSTGGSKHHGYYTPLKRHSSY